MLRAPIAPAGPIAARSRMFRCIALGLPLIGVLSCGGDSSGTTPTSPSGTTGSTTPTPTAEIPDNPQKWVLLPGQLNINEGHPGKSVRVGSQFRTYYVRAIDSALVFATSPDVISSGPITVTNLRRVNVQGNLTANLDHPTVMRRADGKYLLVYDYMPDPAVTACCAKQMVSMISDDGITWGTPVVLPTSDIDLSPGTKKPFTGVAGFVQIPDGSIRVYYTAAGGFIGSARTTDGGLTWTEDPGYRVAGPPQSAFGEPAAMVDTDGSVLLYVGYQLFSCGGTNGTNCYSIRLARSTDGLNFKVYQGGVLTSSDALIDSDVFIGPDGKWRIILGDQAAGTRAQLRVAERQ